MTTHTRALLQAALDAAARGWRVFPLLRGGKQPALHSTDVCPGTGPCAQGHRGWEQRATHDPDEIHWYWTSRRFAGCNVGIACGPSGLLVVDLDAAKPGEQPPARWAAPGVASGLDVFLLVCHDAGQLPPLDTRTVTTPSGGMHLYFAAPPGDELRNTEGDRGRGLGWHIDTRAGGGYVVASGSIVNGRHYELVEDTDPAPLPDWLIERLRPAPLPRPARPVRVSGTDRRARYLDAVLRAEYARVAKAPRGQRNSTLYVAAVALGQLVAGGSLAEHDARQTLLSAASRHIGVGAYSERQAELTIASGLRKGANRPRAVAA
jgi:hypothetical protein